MNLQPLVCPHCGAAINITSSTKVARCEFCNSDIMIEQVPGQTMQQYMQQNPPPEFVTRNQMPVQQFENPNIRIQQFQTFPPGMLYDENALRKWKKNFRAWQVFFSIWVMIFVLIVINNQEVFPGIVPFIVVCAAFLGIPPYLALKKPAEPDARKNITALNILKYYLRFAADAVIAFVLAALIAGGLGMV